MRPSPSRPTVKCCPMSENFQRTFHKKNKKYFLPSPEENWANVNTNCFPLFAFSVFPLKTILLSCFSDLFHNRSAFSWREKKYIEPANKHWTGAKKQKRSSYTNPKKIDIYDKIPYYQFKTYKICFAYFYMYIRTYVG